MSPFYQKMNTKTLAQDISWSLVLYNPILHLLASVEVGIWKHLYCVALVHFRIDVHVHPIDGWELQAVWSWNLCELIFVTFLLETELCLDSKSNIKSTQNYSKSKILCDNLFINLDMLTNHKIEMLYLYTSLLLSILKI